MDLNTCFETTNSLRSLALYSHLLPALLILVLVIFIKKNTYVRTATENTFFLFSGLLAAWLVSDLIAWHSNNYYLVAASWSILDYINILFYLALVCFFITRATRNATLPSYAGVLSVIVAIIPFLITVSGLSVGEFNEPNCEMAGNDFLAIYKVIIETISTAIIFGTGILSTIKYWGDKRHRNQVLVLTIATMAFLLIFSGSEYVATQTEVYEINLYALFTLPIFLLILTFNIVEQGTFTFKQSSFVLAKFLFLIFVLVAIFNLVLTDDLYEFGVTSASTVVTLGFGVLLLRGAKREAMQREKIEFLAKDLEAANVRLKELDKAKSEFVSIASHQLRSPLTAIRGYSSMLAEGSFGQLPAKALDAAKRVQEATALMAMSIEDYLNVSRIESGNMKYNLSDFNLLEMTSKLCDDLRPEALKRSLILLFRSDLKGKGIVNADIGKTNQIIHNLVNNSIKYTQKGSISVFIRDDLKTKRIYIDITDTGIGMSQETISKLFSKFSRADNANSVNTSGTGLGLYVALKMAEQMGGSITCTSQGDGKGSTFTFELPMVM
ncbi:MAG: HAMP domain-containing sensor histidine kinase [Patescibacteria group bacterium]